MKYDNDLVKKLINEGVSYEEIGRTYGVSGTAIKKHAIKIGIPLKIRRKKNENETFNKGVSFKKRRNCLNCGKDITDTYNKFCCSECFHEYQYKKRVDDWKENPEKYEKEELPSFIRRYMLLKTGCQCEVCGWCEINEYTGNIPLEIHHLDGNCKNNKEENLQVLCPNHHSLTKNFGSLNNGNSKRYNLKKYKESLKNRDT